MSDFPVEESVCLLKRATWIQDQMKVSQLTAMCHRTKLNCSYDLFNYFFHLYRLTWLAVVGFTSLCCERLIIVIVAFLAFCLLATPYVVRSQSAI